jgi:DNA-binding LacI/PurR family transcriptional regulator
LTPKHRALSQQLRTEIAAGAFAASGRLPSEAELGVRFGVSRPTVIRALLDLKAEGLIERKAGSGTYVRKPSESLLPTRSLGLLIPERGTTEIFDLIGGELSRLARAKDYPFLHGGFTASFQDSPPSHSQVLAACRPFVDQRVMGVLFAPFEAIGSRGEINGWIADALSQAGIPVVLLDRDITAFPRRSQFDLVSTDNFAGGYLAAEHVVKLGARKVAFFRRPASAPTVDTRIAGVREALVKSGLEIAEGWVKTGEPEDAAFIGREFSGSRWDSVLCANDVTAALLMRTLRKVGLRVPADLRLVGFDDAKHASILDVSLTTIHQPWQDIAGTAFRALMDRIADPSLPVRSLLLTPYLVVRESCGTYEGRED